MIARIVPVGVDAPLAEQRLSDLAVGRSSERPVEGAKNEGQSGSASFGRKQAGGQLSIETKGVEALEPPQALLYKCCGPNRLCTQANGPQDIRTGNCELEAMLRIAKMDVLALVGPQQDCRST